MKLKFTKQVIRMSKYALYGLFLQSVLYSFLLAGDSKAQKSIEDIYLSLHLEDAALTDAFVQIEQKTSFSFAYHKAIIPQGVRLNQSMENSSLGDILRDIAGKSGLKFKRINDNIFVAPLEKHEKQTVIETAAITPEQIKVTGKVQDDEDSEPLPGVSIIVKGTSTGTTTDLDGNFSIDAAAEDILVFSYIGFETQEIPVGNQSIFNVRLKTDYEQLDEVVVIGYGTQKKSDLTGAVSSVSEEDMKSMVTTSLDQALQGRAAGVQVTANSGQPGGGISVRIRGANSINGSNEPLYVIDGVPISGDAGGTALGFDWAGGGNGQTAVSALSTINPADIASVEILKDASATAIYGSRAANGVVIITTKRGRSGESKFTYDAYAGIQEPSKLLDVMNLPQYAEYQNEWAREMNWTPREEFMDPSILGEGTNWQEEIFRSAFIQNHQLGVTGGNDKTKYAISGAYFDQEGTVIGSNFERFSLRLNVDNQAKEWLRVGSSMMFSRTNERITLNDDNGGVVSTAITQAPDIPVRNLDGSYAGPSIEGSNTGITNPVAMALERDLRLKRNRLLTNIYGEIGFLKNLKYRAELGADLQFTNNYGFNPTYNWGTVVNTRANSIREASNSLFYILKNYVTYNTTLSERHNLTLMGGHEIQESQWENMMAGRQEFVSNDIQELNAGDPTTAINSQGKGSSTLQSFFGRFNYDFDGRYLATFTMRADGSSKFGPENKWGYFPSAAVAWKISSESFMEGISAINQLKLRAGWGLVGNEAIPGYAYGAAMTARGTPMGTGFVPSNIPNPEVQWESSEQINLGLDVGLFTNRINLTLDVYRKNVNDLLIRLPMPSYMGGGSWMGISEPWVNAGKVENKGIEVMLNTINATGAFEWSTDVIFSLNRNEVQYIGGETGVIYQNVQWFNTVTRTSEGLPMGMFYGFRTNGIFNSLEEITASPTQNDKVDRVAGVYPGDIRFKDLNGDGVIDDSDREIIGDPNPDFTFGFNHRMAYKNFELTITTNGSYGNEIFNFSRRNSEGMRNQFANQLSTVNDRARLSLIDPSGSLDDPANVVVANAGTNMPRAINTDPNNNTRISDRYVEDGSYWRVQNLILAYNLPEQLISKLAIQRMKVYANVQNLYTFTNYTGFDPEIGAYNQDPLLQGVDNGRYPLPRVYTFGVNLEF